jgi:hypothetical protein
MSVFVAVYGRKKLKVVHGQIISQEKIPDIEGVFGRKAVIKKPV